MTDEEALLRAIRLAPADDASRLVYADWLEERGEGGRAEFLRADAHLQHADASDPGYPAALAGWLRCRDAPPADWIDPLGPRVAGRTSRCSGPGLSQRPPTNTNGGQSWLIRPTLIVVNS